VWMMSCVKVWVWAMAAQNNTAERMKELEACWRRGALDDSLRDHVVLMKPTFKASDLPWVSAVYEGVGAFANSSVDPHGQNQEELTQVQRESLHAAFKEWVKVLSIEEGRYKLWKTEAEAWDSSCAVKLQKWRNDRGFIKESGVKELCESKYNAQGFEKKEGVETWIGQQMTKIADMHPARPQAQILRLLYVDMAALGLNHSRLLADLASMIKNGCENHPETFSAIVIMPNTPSYGKGLKADGVRDKNISSAIKDFHLFVCWCSWWLSSARLGSTWALGCSTQLGSACLDLATHTWQLIVRGRPVSRSGIRMFCFYGWSLSGCARCDHDAPERRGS
jgi:hypothetical protein